MDETMQRQPILQQRPPAFNLEIAGSIGNFAVKTEQGSSVPVRYMQTHIKFTLEDAQQQRIFECLKPVREIFKYKDLGFEDLMQRDIDDARVSTSLIPYLLSSAGGEAVKFFPPIVCVVVPVQNDMKLQGKYPAIAETVENRGEYKVHNLVSGNPGFETFKFEQWEANGELSPYDNARLRLNTNKCQLVIVDGQHRAMALLALYRNIKRWPDDAKAFEEYYSRWNPDTLQQSLSEISLPMVICTFPSLDESSESPITVSKACRSVFLALNKNARPVSTSRNILLDDEDFIAHCERAILEQFKNQPEDAPSAVRLCNFELDADEDKQSLKSTLAISGIMHLFSALERVLLSAEPPEGLHVPSRRYDRIRQSKFEASCLRRLNAPELIGQALTSASSRFSITADAKSSLKASFEQTYGKYFVRGFQKFFPFEAAGMASLWLERQIDEKADRSPQAMLFEGQGIQRVFQSYISQLSAELTEKYGKQVPPYLAAVMDSFRKIEVRLRDYQMNYFKKRVESLLPRFVNKLTSSMYSEVDALYRQVFTTTAFQNALFITFFGVAEELNESKRVNGDAKDDALFDEYLEALNDFFHPNKDDELVRLFATFAGKPSGQLNDGTFKLTKSNNNLRGIVFRGTELKPDEWDKFRYMLLEIWRRKRTENEDLKDVLDRYVSQCRGEVLRSFTERHITHYCREQGVDITELPDTARDRLKRECLDLYLAALNDAVKVPKTEVAQLEGSLKSMLLSTGEEDHDEDEEVDD